MNRHPHPIQIAIARRVQSRLATRADLLAGLLASLLGSAAGPVVVLTLFRQVPSIHGWTGPEVLFCWGFADAVAGVFNMFFAGLYVLNRRYILDGELDRVLLRPMDPYLQVMLDNLSLEEIPAAGLGLVLMGAAVAWGLPAIPPWRWALLPLALLGGVAVLAGVISAFASLGFLLHHRGTAVGLASQLGTFARYPLDLFGAPLRWLLTVVVPFGFAGFYGAALVLGSAGWQACALLQPLVGIAAFGLGYGAFRLGLRRYGSAGS